MNIILIIILYCLIGAIVEFLMILSVLIYTKRHSQSDEQFVEAWNRASNLILITSIFNSNNISKDVSFAFQLHICACTFIWPFHVLVNMLVVIGTYVFNWIDRFFYKLSSFLVKR